MTAEAKNRWMEFATWATKEQDLKDLIETVREINELLDEILPPLPAEQKHSGNSLMKPKPSTLTPKSDELTVLIPIEQQIQQRAYELYEQRGRTDGHDLDDWFQAEQRQAGHGTFDGVRSRQPHR